VSYAEADLLPLSGLQHLACCERQWALIHLEQQWEENRLTAEGRLLHKTVDRGVDETRDGVRMVRSLAVRSFHLGITGKADVVEFPLAGGPPVPVEYKRGRPKSEPWDQIQLARRRCAWKKCLVAPSWRVPSTTRPAAAAL
jgi:CRISPR-associated exonuclease Cas4